MIVHLTLLKATVVVVSFVVYIVLVVLIFAASIGFLWLGGSYKVLFMSKSTTIIAGVTLWLSLICDKRTIEFWS